MATPFKPSLGRQSISRVNSAFGFYEIQTRRNMRNIIKEFKRWVLHMNDQGAQILFDALEPTFKLSQSIVPIKTGALKASGFLEKRSFRGKAQVIMGYGKGGEPKYAALVHERLDYFHAKPGQAKFLEHAIITDFNNIQKRIIKGYKEASSA